MALFTALLVTVLTGFTGLVYEVTKTGTVLASFASPESGPQGITFDGTDFWYADNNSNDIYQLAGPNSILYSAAAYTMTIDVTDVTTGSVVSITSSSVVLSVPTWPLSADTATS